MAWRFLQLVCLSFSVLFVAYLLIDVMDRLDWFAEHGATGLVAALLSTLLIGAAGSAPRQIPSASLLPRPLTSMFRGRDAFGRRRHRGMVQAPRSLPRIIELPSEVSEAGEHNYVFLSSIIRVHVDSLFPGLKVSGCYQFRVTRNSDLYIDDEEVDVIATSDSVKGGKLTFMLWGMLRNKAERFAVESIKAVVRVAGGRRRGGR